MTFPEGKTASKLQASLLAVAFTGPRKGSENKPGEGKQAPHIQLELVRTKFVDALS